MSPLLHRPAYLGPSFGEALVLGGAHHLRHRLRRQPAIVAPEKLAVIFELQDHGLVELDRRLVHLHVLGNRIRSPSTEPSPNIASMKRPMSAAVAVIPPAGAACVNVYGIAS